jgi:hypothetical protein
MVKTDTEWNVAVVDLDYSCLSAMMGLLLVSYDARLEGQGC